MSQQGKVPKTQQISGGTSRRGPYWSSRDRTQLKGDTDSLSLFLCLIDVRDSPSFPRLTAIIRGCHGAHSGLYLLPSCTRCLKPFISMTDTETGPQHARQNEGHPSSQGQWPVQRLPQWGWSFALRELSCPGFLHILPPTLRASSQSPSWMAHRPLHTPWPAPSFLPCLLFVTASLYCLPLFLPLTPSDMPNSPITDSLSLSRLSLSLPLPRPSSFCSMQPCPWSMAPHVLCPPLSCHLLAHALITVYATPVYRSCSWWPVMQHCCSNHSWEACGQPDLDPLVAQPWTQSFWRAGCVHNLGGRRALQTSVAQGQNAWALSPGQSPMFTTNPALVVREERVSCVWPLPCPSVTKKTVGWGAPGWHSRVSVWLQLRSWSHGLWVWASHQVLGWQLRAWKLLWILCLPLSLCPSLACVLSLFLSC